MRRDTMKASSTALMVSILVAGYLLQIDMVSGASTFIGSTVMEVGSDGKVTIKTAQGESWSFPVSDPELLKGVKKGDQVSLELDAQDRVSKIVKTDAQGDGNAAARSKKEQTPGDGY
jgi:hypothetical protein